MMKRILSFLLSAVIIFGLCAVAAPQVSAADELKVSDKGVELIKEYEGFTLKPVYDYGQYSVGYGSACKKDEYPNGITKDQADKLLREELLEVQTHLDKFVAKYSLSLSQQQYDALASFTYNLGPNWMNNTSTFRDAVVNGAKGNDFIFAMTMWCNAGGSIVPGLAQRRLSEANLYLNGQYAKNPPSNYRYVIFDNNMESALTTVKIQGFDANSSDKLRAVPSKTGYRFLGWYTKAEGGEWMTKVGSGVATTTLYAHWQEIAEDSSDGIAASYVRYASKDQPVYDNPNGYETKRLSAGTKLSIVADYMDSDGIKWGRLSGGGWVNLTKTQEYKEDDPGEAVNLKVTVTNNGVNIRKGPGTSYSKSGTVDKGDVLQLTHVQQGGLYLWGQFADGWICLDYTNYKTVSAEASGEADKVTGTGVVNTDKLNIRKEPSASSAKVGQYTRGQKVEITLRQAVGNTTWGKTDKGWISLYYVKMDPAVQPEETKPTEPAPTEPAPTEPAPTEPAPTEPEKPETPDSDKNQVIATGKVVDCNTLRIRAGAGTKYANVGSLARNTKVSLYEMVIVSSQVWGRIDKGWICMTYVKLDREGDNSESTSTTGTIVNCTNLNVRAGAGTVYAKVGKLAKGTRVDILETAKVGNTTWGRVKEGWISLYYVKLDGKLPESLDSTQKPSEDTAEPTEPDDQGSSGTESDTQQGTGDTTQKVNQIGTVTGASEVKLRSAPGTDNKQVGTLKKGQRVVISETAKVGSATWGKTEKGWIHMYYVKLDAKDVPEGSVIRTVTATTLRIRAGAGTGYEAVGSYIRGTQVVITAQTTVGGQVWGRTEKGWICLDYVK